MLQAPNADTIPYLDDMANQGVTDGRISDQQAQELERADIIVMTKNGENQTEYLVIEASINVGDADVDRARKRASIMARLTSRPIRPAVIGQHISPANRQRADGLGVTFMPLSQ